MLYAINGSQVKPMTDIPVKRRAFYNSIIANLAPSDLDKIKQVLNDYFDNYVEDVQVSSFVPGNNWEGTPYQQIYHACNENMEHSGFMFGLILWKVMIEREDHWGFTNAQDSFLDRDINGKVYFRINDPGVL